MPTYNYIGYTCMEREIVSLGAAGELMASMNDVDVATFCGRIGNLYVRHRLSPPFALRDAVEGWIANGIPLSHCVDVIQRYLGHVGDSYSGSGDHNFYWLNGRIHASWHERTFATPPLSVPEQNSGHGRRSDLNAGERNLEVGHGTPYGQHPPNPPGARSVVGDLSRATPRKSASGDQITSSGCHRYGSPGKARSPGPKKIHIAVAWLLTELAKGEQAASVVEAKAQSVALLREPMTGRANGWASPPGASVLAGGPST
jgi:hypothetical protein